MANAAGYQLPLTSGIPTSSEYSTSTVKNQGIHTSPNQRYGGAGSNFNRQRRPTQSHQRLVFTDPVAFRYLEEDPSTNVIDRRRRLEGYEIYIIEQWACSRIHPTFMICTYTGDSSHSILVNVLSVPSDEDAWSPRLKIYFEAVSQFHGRKKDTPLGTIMVTNLSAFPSSLTVIAIPDGDVRKHREDFIVNEDLKRMGCSGRAAINIQPPQSSTIAKYHQLYRTSENVPTYQSVMELVKMCQVALVMYGLLQPTYTDGMLCDLTEKAISDWWTEIGIYFYNVEPSDGILGPTTVAALLGLLIGAYNRLKTSGAPVGKDVLDILSMKRAVGNFQKTQKMERSRRLDRETLDRLHRATAKTASGEGWNVQKAVKSTVAELSGKGGEMVMGIVGGRDKAGISDAETLDIERFAQLVTSARMRWLWHGKHLKQTEAFGTSPDETLGKAFGTDDAGAFIWTGTKAQFGSDRDLERTDTVSTHQLDGKSGFGRIIDAVGGLKSHSQRPSRDANEHAESTEWLHAVSQRSSGHEQRANTGPFSYDPVGVHPAALTQALAEAPTTSKHVPQRPLRPSRSSHELERKSYREQLKPATNAESPGKRLIEAEMAELRHEFKSDTYQNFSAEFVYGGPRSKILRRSQSAIHVVDLGPDRARENRLQRFASFSLVESSVFEFSNPFTDDIGNELNDTSPSTDYAAQEAITASAQRRMRLLLQIQQALIPFTQTNVANIDSLDRDAQDHLEELTSLYYQRLDEYQTLRATSSDVVMQEKSGLTESLRRIEMLGAKLDYELNALQSRMQEVEDGIDEFDRNVLTIEAKVRELTGNETRDSVPWFQRLINLMSPRK